MRYKQRLTAPPHQTARSAEQSERAPPATGASFAAGRREFLERLGAGALLAASEVTFGAHGAAAAPATELRSRRYQPLGDAELLARRDQSRNRRLRRAQHWHDVPFTGQLANDDELIHAAWGMFSKGLPHDRLGHPDGAAFGQLVLACTTGEPADFGLIPLGGVQPLRNPQSALAFEFCGSDPNQTLVPPAPELASAWRAGEQVENYWSAHLRDVHFSEYATHPQVAAACADLSALSDFRGPRIGGQVTPETLFRGPWEGCLDGPYVSQFLLKDTLFGSQPIVQKQRAFMPGLDYMTGYADWLQRQNGAPWPARAYDPIHRYIQSARDLATWVDADPPLQAGLLALLILLDEGMPLDPANPYGTSIFNQDGFTTFGPVDFFDLVGRAPMPALKAAWFQKWRIHRCLRPEEYGGRLHNHMTGAFSYPLHDDVVNSAAVQEAFSRQGSYLLSQAYPDGCPVHPAYPSGHSVAIGSAVTMLKALFDETAEIAHPVQPTPDGSRLQPYHGPPLTVLGELNKLAWNISAGRMHGGIHWRSDYVEGHRLGQQVAVTIMRDLKTAYREPYAGYTLTKFEGGTIRI